MEIIHSVNENPRCNLTQDKHFTHLLIKEKNSPSAKGPGIYTGRTKAEKGMIFN